MKNKGIEAGEYSVVFSGITHNVQEDSDQDFLMLSFTVLKGWQAGQKENIFPTLAQKTIKNKPMPKAVLKKSRRMLQSLADALEHPLPDDCFIASETENYEAILNELIHERGKKLKLFKSVKPNLTHPEYPYIDYSFEKLTQEELAQLEQNPDQDKKLKAAVSYAKKGFSVIPVGSNKRPLIKFADRKPLTPDEVQEFWTQHPHASIALQTTNFFVIDVDRHNGIDGMKSIRALNHDEWFKDTLLEKTANDGYHFFFQKPDGLKITQNIGLLKGVDLKAHPNNYVVVAPSSTGERKYQWLNKLPMKKAPAGLIKLIHSKNKPRVKEQKHNKIISFKQTARTNKLAKCFEMIDSGLGEEGTRNSNLTSFLGTLLYHDVDPDVIINLTELANERTTPPLPIKEVENTINSIFTKELRRRGA